MKVSINPAAFTAALLTTVILFSNSQVHAWGGRGHDAICASAVYLVQEPGLKEYLKNKPQMMGHLCNMPDFFWKTLPGDARALGDATHFIDIEVLGIKVKDVSVDFKKLSKEYTGKENKFKGEGALIKDFPREFGSSWWRADQFMRRMAALKKDLSKSKAPQNFREEQNDELPFNKAAHEFVINMGLLGHFVGDNSQPFHTSADYDGYAAGHGGIHSYFEDEIVSHFDGDLEALILSEARAMKDVSFLKQKNSIDKMKVLSEISNNEIPAVLKLDPVTTKSILKNEKGMELKTKAVREDSLVAFNKMKPMIVTQMARGSLLLANLWDEAYRSVGKPKLASYKSYKYPFTVDFVTPDYLQEKTSK